MRIYHVEFHGLYPTGAAHAVIVAASRITAIKLLRERLALERLLDKNDELAPGDFVEITTDHAGIKFFKNGDY